MKEYGEVLALLPPGLRQRGEALPALLRRRVEEVRLRCGRPPTVVLGREELPLPGEGGATRNDLERVVEIATRASAHTALERVRQGYFTVRGGHRIGLCGTAVLQGGEVRNLTALSSLNIRLHREHPGCGEGVWRELNRSGSPVSALLLGPPGAGKTTLLRDLCRLTGREYRVGLCDERGEVAALWDGTPQFDVGERTDVLEGCPKDRGLLMLLRGMGPQILCADEITHPDDIAALAVCGNCGAVVLCTLHARDGADLLKRPLGRTLLGLRLFGKLVVGRDHRWQVEEVPQWDG